MTETTQTLPKAEAVYFGLRDAMVAEVSAFGFVEGKYLIMPAGDVQFDTEGADTLKDAKAIAAEQAAWLGCKIVRV